MKFGATHCLNGGEEGAVAKIREITGGLGPDVAAECVGIPPPMHQAYEPNSEKKPGETRPNQKTTPQE